MLKLRAIFISGLSLVMFGLVAQPVQATGTYYVDSITGNDANNCTSADTACLTVAGAKALIIALADPADTTLKLNGVFTDQVVFYETDVIAPDTLDGLRITATDTSNQPIIDTTVAGTSAMYISNINHVTVDYITVTGGTAGIDVTGTGATYIADISIHHNSVTGLTDDESSYGIRLQYAKKSHVHDNNVHDVAINLADVGNSTYFYGIMVAYVFDTTIRDNTVSDVGVTDAFSAAGGHSSYVYGLYTSNMVDTIIANNTLTGIYATETASVTGTYHYLYAEGIYGNTLVDVVMEDNTIQNISSTVDADIDANSAAVYAYGIVITEMRSDGSSTELRNNTIADLTATNASKSGSATSQGINFTFGYTVGVINNSVENITANHSSTKDEASTAAYVIGMYTTYFGNAMTVSKNNIDTLTANINYSGANSSGTVNVRGIYNYGGQATISGNVIEHLTRSINNANSDSYYDNASSYGIDVNNASGSIIKNNRIRNFSDSYNSSGTAGTAYFNNVGINAAGSDNISILKNQISNLDFSFSVSDPTDATYTNVTGYGMFLFRLSNANISGNRMKQITSAANAGNANTLFHYVDGFYLNTVSGLVSNNRIANYIVSSQVVNGGISQLFYGLSVSTQSTATITGNLIRDITTTTTGATSSHQDAGMFIAMAPNLILDGNEIRPFTSSSSNGDNTMYGIHFGSDASKTRLVDNIILGDKDFIGSSHTGIYLPSDSTLDIDIINNNVVNWKYPFNVEGGSKVYLRNNIFSAVGAEGYALGIGRDQVNNDTFKSDYNLFYNKTVVDQLVYDTDNTMAIAFGDWTNVGGSWGFDVHSINENPKLNVNGYLRKGSKAINAGSNVYPYVNTAVEYGYLQTDVNGTERPIAQDNQVDIGADEYKK